MDIGRLARAHRLLRNRAMVAFYLGIALGVMTLAVVAMMLYDEREAARRQAEQEAGNIALALERDIGRVLSDFDLSLQAAQRGMQLPNLQSYEPRVRQAILFDGAVAGVGRGGVFITDEQGTSLYESARVDARSINLADREYFQSLRQNANLGLVVSKPVISRGDGQASIALARRINHADGSFAGVVTGAVKLSLFQSLFSALELGPESVINLVTTDRVMIARFPLGPEHIGRDMADSPLFAHLSLHPTGGFEAVASVDGIRRLYSYRQVGAFPLVVGVGLSLRDIDAPWKVKATVIGGVLMTLALLTLGAMGFLRRELWRRARAEAATCQSELRLADSLARLDALFTNTTDSMLVARATPSDRFVYEVVNPVWERISGVPQASAIGKGPEACLPPELATKVLEVWRDCVQDRRTVAMSFRAKILHEWRDWESSVAPVFNADGSVGRIVSVARDVTERIRLEASLRQSQRMEAVGQLTAGVAHDFNNLLQCVIGALELLQQQPDLSTECRRHARMIDGAVSRGSAMVHSLLAFSRKQPLQPNILNPPAILDEIAPMISSLLGGTIQVALDVEHAAWSVRADAAQLQSCLVNLVLNARDAMPDGGVIRLIVCNKSGPEAQAAGLPPVDHVCFTVADAGTGMDAETLSRAMEPFFTTKAIGQGTGLGLSMVQGFAKQSGGDVTIQTAIGQGTTVRLWLPRAVDVTREGAVMLANETPSCASAKRVMVVDDVADVRDTLVTMLTDAGMSAIAVDTGDAGLALLQGGEPCDLLVTDQSMPGLKGSELIRHAAQLRPAMPTVLITGYDKVSGLEALYGRVTVLRKPFRCAAFLNQVHALLAHEKLVPQPAPPRPHLVTLHGKAAVRASL